MNGKREGTWREYRKEYLLRESLYERGTKHGVQREFCRDGAVELEVSLVNGQRHGRAVERDCRTGVIVSEGRYESGRRVGAWLFRTRDGVIIEEKSGVFEGGKRIEE